MHIHLPIICRFEACKIKPQENSPDDQQQRKWNKINTAELETRSPDGIAPRYFAFFVSRRRRTFGLIHIRMRLSSHCKCSLYWLLHRKILVVIGSRYAQSSSQ